MCSLIDELIKQINENALQNKAFLIGFSGGVDSTALLHLFVELRQRYDFPLRAIHIHHGLSVNADHWLEHCQQFCAQFKIPFIAKKVQLASSANIEAEARKARYQAIQAELQANEILVTAHHLDDQCETFLLALKRGSGVKGLSAMPTQTQLFSVPIFRPLLRITRSQLEQYITEHQLAIIFDESNDDTRYERNFLRNEVLPLLRARWHSIDQAIVRSAQLCAEQQQLLEELLQPILLQHLSADGCFHLQQFADYSREKQKQLLRLWLAHWQQPMPTQKQLQVLLDEVVAAEQDRQPELQLNNRMVRRFQDQLYLTPIYQSLQQQILPLAIGQTLLLPDGLGEISCEQSAQGLLLSWQQHQFVVLPPVNFQQMTIRFHYSKRVKIAPQAKHTDIKKVWQKLKVPTWQRTRIPLLFIDEHFYGAIGYFKNYAE